MASNIPFPRRMPEDDHVLALDQATRQTILPDGAIAWDQVLEPPLRFAPWPYTEAELQRIRDALPAAGADIAITKTIFTARIFLVGEHIRRKHATPPKPDPRGELERILRASKELRAAIRAASLEALQHLLSHPSPGAGNPPFLPGDVRYVLLRFEHDNCVAFRDLPERDLRGAPETLREEALVYGLWTAWRFAHGMRPPARRWPAFRTSCVDPLRGARFPKDLRPADRIERAWQQVLRRARDRFEGAIK
jgi:hypothetical protein